MDLAIAERVSEGHQNLAVGGIAVVPSDSKVSPGDAETLEGFVGAVRSGHPVDERCRSTRDLRGRRWRRFRLRSRLRLRLNRGSIGLQLIGVRCLRVARGGWIRPGR